MDIYVSGEEQKLIHVIDNVIVKVMTSQFPVL